MAFTESSGERDFQVVASKLPQEEFANFKKVCDLENKTPSKKIRELINKEVDERFGNIYRSKYDKEKVKQFNLATLRDYTRSLMVEDICKVNLVERTDGRFTQIGLRPLMEEDMLLPDQEGVHFHPELPGLGSDVAVGERNFLIQQILANKDIEKIKLKKEELLDFQKENNFQESTILASLDFFMDFSRSLIKRIEYKEGKTILDFRHKLDFIPEEMMKGKIILIEKDSILWAKQKFYNQFSNKDEGLDILIQPKIGGKVDITVRSVNRIKDLDPEGIKILEVEG